jgi:hypothetical protein
MRNRMMNKYNLFLFSLILSLISFSTVPAQKSVYPKNSPEWLVDMFFNQTQFPEKDKYLIGEMMLDVNYPTIGEELDGRATVTIRKIELINRKGVYGVVIKDDGNTANFYCYVRNISGSWKIEAVRKFQLPGSIYSSADSLSRIENLPDSASSLLKILKLLIGTDEQLKLFLSENINDFYSIAGAFDSKRVDDLNFLMNKLNLEYIYSDEIYPQCIFVLVGRFDRIEVGYIFSKNKSSMPIISFGRFIYIEEVLPNYYVYRAI